MVIGILEGIATGAVVGIGILADIAARAAARI